MGMPPTPPATASKKAKNHPKAKL
ncbi:hypothetical protein CCACVL1_13019 [Corchorus capsularis]|uniref:Uncharacterized protein n=1 Tax=Corchorus capsularis TaxID=210143 RepID=A0A1R3ICK9_COCAP|nr:hypothetical protein CCACVL1_13019 [Corchorus capsularis]